MESCFNIFVASDFSSEKRQVEPTFSPFGPDPSPFWEVPLGVEGFFWGVRGDMGGVSCFYSFGEPLKTWTYAMLTCIVYHVILLYS